MSGPPERADFSAVAAVYRDRSGRCRLPARVSVAGSLEGLWEQLVQLATTERTVAVVRAVVTVAIALLIARYVKRWVRSLGQVRADPQRAVIVGRLAQWILVTLGVAAAFEELGFKLHVLLGAAGVLSVAVGFAAQTTLSNLISGFFLFGERPFGIGDTIEVDTTSGEVLSIGMLATTLRTADHRYVRIPNETLIKTRVVNTTRSALRRIEVVLPVAYREDVEKVKAVLEEIVAGHALCRTEPPPSVSVQTFGETSYTVQVLAWAATAEAGIARAQLAEEILGRLEGIRRSELGPS
jgi:small-conductance mechanosensitive channel